MILTTGKYGGRKCAIGKSFYLVFFFIKFDKYYSLYAIVIIIMLL